MDKWVAKRAACIESQLLLRRLIMIFFIIVVTSNMLSSAFNKVAHIFSKVIIIM